MFAVNCHVHLVPVWVELAQVEAANRHGGAAITHNAELAEALTDTHDSAHDVDGVGDRTLLGRMASRSPSYRQIRLAGALTMFGCSALYFVTGVCGYIALGEDTTGDVLKSYPLSDPWVDAARVAMGVHLFFAFPLSLFPLWKTVRFWTSTPRVPRMSMDEAAISADVGRVDDAHEESARSHVSLWARCGRFGPRLLFHVAIVLVVVVIAVQVPQASDVFSVVGGTFGSTLVYLFPAAMRLRSFVSASKGGRTASGRCGVAAAGFALIFGIFVAVISTLCSISVLECGAIGKADRNVTRL